jgi:hypothetical protein
LISFILSLFMLHCSLNHQLLRRACPVSFRNEEPRFTLQVDDPVSDLRVILLVELFPESVLEEGSNYFQRVPIFHKLLRQLVILRPRPGVD